MISVNLIYYFNITTYSHQVILFSNIFTVVGWCYLHFRSMFNIALLYLVQFVIHSVVSWFVLFLFWVTFSLHIFIMFIPYSRYFFPSKFLHPEFGSKCCKYTLTAAPAPKTNVRTSNAADVYRGQTIEYNDWILTCTHAHTHTGAHPHRYTHACGQRHIIYILVKLGPNRSLPLLQAQRN